MDNNRKTYKKLKGVRSEIKIQTIEIKKRLIAKDNEKIDELEQRMKRLTKNKTRLRKKFEKLTKSKGPYSCLS